MKALEVVYLLWSSWKCHPRKDEKRGWRPRKPRLPHSGLFLSWRWSSRHVVLSCSWFWCVVSRFSPMAGDRKVCLTFSGNHFRFSADRLRRRSAGFCWVDGKNRMNEFNSLVKFAVSHANKSFQNGLQNVKKNVRNFLQVCVQIVWLQRIRRLWLSSFL